MRLKDFSKSIIRPEEEINKNNLQKIANVKIDDLSFEENQNLLIFPHCLGKYGDKIGSSSILSLHENMIITNSIMGFVGVNDGVNNTQLTIASRFENKKENDFFLHYMLQKVFSINLFDLKHSSDPHSIFDFLLYLFPYYLNKALRHGLFKNYQKREYNDANVRGAIDVNRHIRMNTPFSGKIAYKTREHVYDNHVTQLIRHTIEFINQHPFAGDILQNSLETKDNVSQIIHTTPTYDRNKRTTIINQNIKPFHHPYYFEYKNLQKICLQILRYEQLKFGEKEDEIYGILFDGAWLWEEYLAIVLQKEFKHYIQKENKQYLFEKKGENIQQIVPDFLSHDKKIVADAKYIPLEKQEEYEENSERATNIYYKTIMYMYRFNCNTGFLIFPHSNKFDDEHYDIIGTKGKLVKLGLTIPQEDMSFMKFKEEIAKNEQDLLRKIENLITNID